jgi:hypothetical protein
MAVLRIVVAFLLGAALFGLLVRRVWEDRLYMWLGQRRPRYQLFSQ